jgi:hypothetical protein
MILRYWQKWRAACSSCAVFGHWFVNCKKVRSFVFPGTLDMRVRNGTVTAVELMVS